MPPWPRARAGISHCPWSPAPVAFRPLCLVARLSERQRVAAPIVSSLAKYLTRYAVYARRLAFSLFPRVPSSEIAAVGRSGRRTAAGPNGASSDAQGDAPVGQGRALPDRHRPAIGTSGARRGRTRPSQRGQGRSDPEQYDIVYVTPFFFSFAAGPGASGPRIRGGSRTASGPRSALYANSPRGHGRRFLPEEAGLGCCFFLRIGSLRAPPKRASASFSGECDGRPPVSFDPSHRTSGTSNGAGF